MATSIIRHTLEVHFCPSLIRKFFGVLVQLEVFVFGGVEADSLHQSPKPIILPYEVAEAERPGTKFRILKNNTGAPSLHLPGGFYGVEGEGRLFSVLFLFPVDCNLQVKTKSQIRPTSHIPDCTPLAF